MIKQASALMAIVAAVAMFGCVSQKTYDRDIGLERQINQQLESEVQSDQVQITRLQDRLRVSVEGQILFGTGSAALHPRGKALLDKLVSTLQSATDNRIEVEGYTDDVPIGKHLKKKYKSNWELSAARAASVVEYLQMKGIDPSRLTAAGHSQYQPTDANTTAAGRAENRRTDIDLVPIHTQ